MFFYLLYLLGNAACLLFPRRVCYAMACRIADLYCRFSTKDRRAVETNLSVVLGTAQVSPSQVREVFRNFGMYLSDFFRFSRLTQREIQEWVSIEGLEHLQAALSNGFGAILLTAHLGNYELGGAILSLLGFPVNAVVLNHQNSRINDFFIRQRKRVGVRGFVIGSKSQRASFEGSLAALRRNEILGLVGDRDFSQHGLVLSLFGKSVRLPKGPASMSLKTGAPILPTFVVREANGRYRFFIEPPIPVPKGVSREEAIRRMTLSCGEAMARAIGRYPTQWYLFQEFWKPAAAFIL